MRVEVGATWDGVPVGDDERVEVEVGVGDPWVVRVRAPYHADPPPPGPPGPTDRLWEHEVVELFVVGDGDGPPYTEIELGPHGHYLVLRLRGARRVVETLLPGGYRAAIHRGRWEGRLRLDPALLPAPKTFNAFAIHGVAATRRYLAAHPVPGPGPDFHRLGHFAPWPAAR